MGISLLQCYVPVYPTIQCYVPYRGAKTWSTVFTCYSGIYTTQHYNGITILYLFTRYIPLATVINFISPFSQFDAYIHKLLDIDIWFLATTRKLRKSPAFQFLVLAVNHFVLMAILNTILYLSNIQWYVYLIIAKQIDSKRKKK